MGNNYNNNCTYEYIHEILRRVYGIIERIFFASDIDIDIDIS